MMAAPCLRQLDSEDAFRRKTQRIYEEVNEQVLEDEYEFLTEEDMRTQDKPFSESLEAFSCVGHPWGKGCHIDTEWYNGG